MLKLQRIIEYLLYLFVFLLPFQTRFFLEKGVIGGDYLEYTTISVYASDIILVVLLSLFLIFWAIKAKAVGTEHCSVHRENNTAAVSLKRLPIIWWLISGLDLMIFLSIFVAEDHILSLYRYGIFLLGVGLFWVLLNFSYSRIKLFLSLAASLLIQAGIGVWQFLIQTDLSSKWLGMAAHLPSRAGTSVVKTAQTGERWLRAYGGMDHPNILGGVLVIGILVMIGVVINYKLRIRQSAEDHRSKIKRAYLLPLTSYLLVPVFIIALFFTFSRGAWLSLLVGLFVLLTTHYLAKNKQISRSVSKIVLLIILLVSVLSFMYPNIVSTRLGGGSELEARSVNTRVKMIGDSWKIINDNFLLGTGIGNYSVALHQQHPDRPGWSYQPVHNTFLLVLAEIGFIGALFFVSILAWMAAKLYQRRNYWGLSILASLMIILLFEHWLWSLHFGVLFFWLALGIIYDNKFSIPN